MGPCRAWLRVMRRGESTAVAGARKGTSPLRMTGCGGGGGRKSALLCHCADEGWARNGATVGGGDVAGGGENVAGGDLSGDVADDVRGGSGAEEAEGADGRAGTATGDGLGANCGGGDGW